MIDIVCAAIAAWAALACAIITSTNARRHKKAEMRAELRSRESRLMLDMIYANSQLTIGTALAIKKGYSNGELDAGLDAVRNCDEKYQEFLQEIAITHLTK